MFVQVLHGKHAGKRGFAYNRDQEPAIVKAKKVAVWIPEETQGALFADCAQEDWKKVLFSPESLKLIGFID